MHLSINYKITPFLLILLSPLSSTPSFARQLTSIELIANAYRNGEIDYRESLNYRVAAVLNQEGLPEAYRSKVPVKSATMILLEARSNKHLLSPANATLLAKGRVQTLTDLYGSGVTLLDYMSPKRRFRIHYTTEGNNAVPSIDDNPKDNIPDYVEKFADILDHVSDTEINDMGYNAAPSDDSEGGDCLLDVYLGDLKNNSNFGAAYGLTEIDLGDPSSYVYLIFDNDYSGFPANLNPGGQVEGDMKVTAAHEFFHTIQFQITDDITNYGWWMEASATWMEDRVYPEVNDYVNYIGDWFDHPNLPLDTYNSIISPTFQYGTSVWIKHMTEKYGSKFVFDVWNKIRGGDSALSAVEESLTERGTTLEEELKELRVADVTLTYDDGSIYKTWDNTNPISVPFTNTADFAKVGTVTYNNVKLDTLASEYDSFSPPGGSGALKIDFKGDGNIRVMVIGLRSTGYDVTEILPDSTDIGTITVDGFSSDGPYTGLVVIPLNYSTTDQGNFNLTGTYTTTLSDNIASITIIPVVNTSIVTGDEEGDSKVIGRQQYFIIQKDKNEKQVLESGTTWASSDSPAVKIDNNGLVTASEAIAGDVISASLGGLSTNTSLSSNNPVTMTPGTPRDCNVNSSSSNKRCFIATAAFGSPFHPYVEILREFRDSYLLTNSPGRKIISLYYFYSPPFAEKIARNAILRAIVQLCLIPAIIFSGLMIKTTMVEKILTGSLLIIIVAVLNQKSKIKNQKCISES